MIWKWSFTASLKWLSLPHFGKQIFIPLWRNFSFAAFGLPETFVVDNIFALSNNVKLSIFYISFVTVSDNWIRVSCKKFIQIPAWLKRNRHPPSSQSVLESVCSKMGLFYISPYWFQHECFITFSIITDNLPWIAVTFSIFSRKLFSWTGNRVWPRKMFYLRWCFCLYSIDFFKISF